LSEANTEVKPLEAPKAPVVGLSSREHEVITLAAKGASNKEIAHMLGVAHATVRVLVSRAAAKWRVKTRAELISAFQRELGTQSPPTANEVPLVISTPTG
jgi:DNA-binding NarL/FixJ family response regulator